MLFFKPAPELVVDVAVTGSGLSALVAAWCCHLNGLSTALFCVQPMFAGRVDFDSLAPQGVRYLHHMLTAAQIQALSQGKFHGIHRDGDYQAFEPSENYGLQIDSGQLKALLWHLLLDSSVQLIAQPALHKTLVSDRVLIETADGEKLLAGWCLDASGQNSRISEQTPTPLGRDLWVRRSTESGQLKSNCVEFNRLEYGWEWLAYNHNGIVTRTEYSAHFSELDDKSTLFNCQWYCRQRYTEKRTLLLTPTCYRFDPTSGLEISTTLNFALLATKLVSRMLMQNQDFQQKTLQYYENVLQNDFCEKFSRLSVFYQSGISRV